MHTLKWEKHNTNFNNFIYVDIMRCSFIPNVRSSITLVIRTVFEIGRERITSFSKSGGTEIVPIKSVTSWFLYSIGGADPTFLQHE